jgi:formylglycine-generating enzyme required for sulfatase activity
VSSLSHTVRIVVAALAIAIASAGIAKPAPPQEPPGGTSAASMKAYSQVIPGTEIKFEMVPIPGGTFEMGAPAGEAKHGKDEEPQRTVQIEPFWMGAKEVTWDEYEQFAFSYDLKQKKRTGVDLTKQSELELKADAVTRPTPPYADSTFGHGRSGQPAICITHHAVMEYCRWLSEKTGLVYRLPTEAEWEYACRAGTRTAYFWGDELLENNEYAWFVNNCEKPMPVGKKKPSPWGLYDIHGNVAEWCLDHYDPEAYKKFAASGPSKGPVVLPDAKEYPYVARGGSWDDDPEALRSAARKASTPEWSVQDPQRPQSIWWHTDATFVGFRIVRPLKEQDNLKGLKSQVVKGKTIR